MATSSRIHTQQQQTKKNLNLLLIGHSGIGKSRFINSFANYVEYSKIQDIKSKEDVHVPIPCVIQVQLPGDDLEMLEVRIRPENNVDQNESLNPLESQTRGCKSYTFNFEDVSITLIDTPGIADTDGIDQDKANLERTIEFISTFGSINAIAILLRPNERRLDPKLRYCFLEILSQFNIAAAHNIIFLFTHARDGQYGPGTTKGAIDKMIKEIQADRPQLSEFKFSKQNSFYFDNEALDYILTKGDVEFDAWQRDFYNLSWNKSRNECERLIRHIRTLVEHEVSSTVAIFQARRLIECILPILINITKAVTENEQRCREQEAEIREFDGTEQELMSKLRTKKTVVEVVHYDGPRWICGSTDCSPMVTVDGVQQNLTTQVCYSSDKSIKQHLAESGVLSSGIMASLAPEVLVPVAGAALVVAGFWFASGQCSVCGCNNTQHRPSYYETFCKEIEVTDKEIAAQLLHEKGVADKKKAFLLSLTEKLEAHRLERETVQRANGVFAVFLKHRAITPYNDAYSAYIKYLIQLEQQKGNLQSRKLQNLQKQMDDYNELKRVIEEGSESETGIKGSDIDLTYIEGMVEILCSLEEYGHMIRTALVNKDKMSNKFSCFSGPELQIVKQTFDCTKKKFTELFENLVLG